jgi:hypothetical protein
VNANSTPIPVPDSDDVLEFEPTEDGLNYIASVTRRRPDGSSRWTVTPPQGRRIDAWTDITVDGSLATAYSWSGYLVALDLETGAESSRQFTK